MPKRPTRPRDVNQLAKLILDIATGAAENVMPAAPKAGQRKKVDNHKAAVALHFMHYNFARIHKTLRVTPAMEAGVTDRVWSLEEIADLAG